MLDNIKSKYIIKLFFSVLDEIKKLTIVKYNKSLQDKLEINLINYKIFIGRYIKFENEQKMKEYNVINDSIAFEGEYLNGKRNGKGKEYNVDGKLIFEGIYLNGKRNGHGKEYDKNKLIFEAEYLNGERNGKGKEYNEDGSLIYEGGYLNGKINGKGKEYYYDLEEDCKIKFEGEYLNDKRWNGIIYSEAGDNIIYNITNGNGKVKEYNKFGELVFDGKWSKMERKRIRFVW